MWKQVQESLHKQSIDIDIKTIWDALSDRKLTTTTIPLLLTTVMSALKVVNLSNSKKKQVAIEIMTCLIRDKVIDKLVQQTLIDLLPQLIDTFCELANNTSQFKNKIKKCCF